MPFTYEPITPADRERMESLNIMIGWKKPNAKHWTVNRETGDFLVWISPDREPPHWTWFALWWQGRIFRVELDGKTHQDTGYRLEIAGVSAEDRRPISSQERPSFGAALFDAVKAYAIADVSTMFANRRKRLQLAPDPSGTPPLELETTLNDLSVSPFATFRIDFPRSIQ